MQKLVRDCRGYPNRAKPRGEARWKGYLTPGDSGRRGSSAGRR